MTVAANAHLYPFTLAFDEGLRAGTIDLATAETFIDRCWEAWCEAKIRANPRLAKAELGEALCEIVSKELPAGQ